MTKSAREKEAVLSVFAELVRPLMRVAFEYGISAGEIAGVVRRTYIEALEARLLDQKRSTTDARLAVVAGCGPARRDGPARGAARRRAAQPAHPGEPGSGHQPAHRLAYPHGLLRSLRTRNGVGFGSN